VGRTERERLGHDLRRLRKILAELRGNVVFVEGRRDKAALAKLGCTRIMTISGNLRKSCAALGRDVTKVIVLTDMDRRGGQLLGLAKAELEACSIEADTETRRPLAGILGLRFFEDAARKHLEFMEKVESMENENKTKVKKYGKDIH
jgi:5S rRNA maturation endonuclease (ribonuclease M5)